MDQNKIKNITLSFLIIFSVYCALTMGMSWDELLHLEWGNKRLKYLLSFGSYDYHGGSDQGFYPSFYDTLLAFVTKLFPKKFEIETLHLVNYSFSLFSIFGISKISSELFNKKIGKIVFVLSFLNPAFFGHMAINQKDMIIAFANIWTTYLIIRYLKNQEIDEKRKNYVLLAGLVVGLGLGVRIVFLGSLIPIFIISFLDIIFFKKLVSKQFTFNKLIIDILKILVISYIIMISCWPETHSNIFILPFKLLIESFGENTGGVSTSLLNGSFYNTSETPKFYLLINLLYKLPEFILFSYLIFIFLILKNKVFFNLNFDFFNVKLLLVLFIILFPNLIIFFSPYKIYDGIRFFLYLIPYICIIPALVIYYLIVNYKFFINKIFLISVFSLFVIFFINFILLTPYQYTYLNALNGDFKKTHKKFENDYWSVSMKELVSKISNNKNLLNNSKLKLSFCGAPDDNVKIYLKKIKNFKFKQVNWITEDYDYIIMTNRVISADIGEDDIVEYNLSNAETCFDRFKGTDIITVKRKGLILSTLREKISNEK